MRTDELSGRAVTRGGIVQSPSVPISGSPSLALLKMVTIL